MKPAVQMVKQKARLLCSVTGGTFQMLHQGANGIPTLPHLIKGPNPFRGLVAWAPGGCRGSRWRRVRSCFSGLLIWAAPSPRLPLPPRCGATANGSVGAALARGLQTGFLLWGRLLGPFPALMVCGWGRGDLGVEDDSGAIRSIIQPSVMA